ALGYVVAYADLDAALGERVRQSGVALHEGAEFDTAEFDTAQAESGHVRVHYVQGGVARHCDARCIAHAEGSGPPEPDSDEGDTAFVARVTLRDADPRTAFERFSAQGPLALLPLADSHALVWSAGPDSARALAAASDAAFLEALAAALGPTIGAPVQVGARSVHPVRRHVRATRVEHRRVFVGNAAQTLHPVAGQGLNLGLRDAWDLADTWRSIGHEDPGAREVLAGFAARRQVDAKTAIALTDALVQGFALDLPGAAWLRGAAMALLDVLPPARRFFARRMIFGSSAIP
ncbi:MAG: FAD-dependent monooxygenase, partial [Proteobacteria bacterium]|nr:FAD-dependent monooxygenase [Pseudomonadota bacterium]